MKKIVNKNHTFLQNSESVKQTAKKYEFSKKTVVRICVSFLYVFWNIAKSAIRVCVDEEFRAIFLLQLLNSKYVHQTTPLTFMNRYPTIFSMCRKHFGGKQDLKILSFGCSTGEEVLTLRQYFPNAYIVGAEINKYSLAICRKLPVDGKITFLYSTLNEIGKHGPFDAIFCMAVLQRLPHYIESKGISSLKKIYPFEKFERQIVELDKMINPQGLLIVHFTQYSVWDTSIASKYKALGVYQTGYISPVFDRYSNLVKNPAPQNSIFVKLHR